MKADPKINSAGNLNLLGPSVSVTWTPEMVWDTGFIPAYSANLYALTVEQYVYAILSTHVPLLSFFFQLSKR
jgi:hypothetical protein